MQQGARAQAVRWTVCLEIACQIVVMLGLLERSAALMHPPCHPSQQPHHSAPPPPPPPPPPPLLPPPLPPSPPAHHLTVYPPPSPRHQVYELPIKKAARKLDIGETVLKQYRRKFAIRRWPYRTLKSVDNLVEYISKYAASQPDPELRQSYVNVVKELQEFRWVGGVMVGMMSAWGGWGGWR
jgi:hypothetical protein